MLTNWDVRIMLLLIIYYQLTCRLLRNILLSFFLENQSQTRRSCLAIRLRTILLPVRGA